MLREEAEMVFKTRKLGQMPEEKRKSDERKRSMKNAKQSTLTEEREIKGGQTAEERQ